MAPKTPAGEMTAPELRKLIRAHNILSKIVIPKGTDREGLIKLIEGKNYKVDHKDKVIRPKQQRGKQITLKKAEELTKPKPVSEEVKKQRAEKKKEQEEAKQKDIKIAKKEAVQEFKKKKKEAEKKKPVPKQAPKPKVKVMKKEDEVRPKEKVGPPKVDPKKIKVIEPKEKLYEKEYNLFLKLFNEAKERRNRKPFQELRDKIFRFTEQILVGTASSQVQDGARLKALKEPFMKKIEDIRDKVDTQIKKYVDIGKKTTGGQQTRPKKEIKISNKPALNTKKIEPKKKEEPIKNEIYKITEKFMKDNDIFSQEFLKLYKESGEQTPEFKKLYKKKQRLIAKYISENGGQSITTELKKLRTPWLKAWIESDEAYEKFLKSKKKYSLISKGDNFLDYLKSRLD